MSVEKLRLVARGVIEQLVRKDYDGLIQRCTKSRLTGDAVRKVIGDYGRTLVLPPSAAYQTLDAVEVRGAAVPTWSVRAPIWTAEEGRSDLTLELTIALGPGEPNIELDDLHVL